MAAAITDRIKVIDVDTHISEPEDLWTSRVSAKWGDRIPHVVKAGASGATGDAPIVQSINIDRGADNDIWLIDGKPGMPTALLAWSGHDQHWPGHPHTLADAHQAASVAEARLKLMDDVGVHANLLFPNVGGSRQYLNIAKGEPDLALECCQAYNDFLTDWCSADPDRLLAQVSLPLWDIPACVAEIERNAAAGHKSVMMTYQPDGYGLPWLADSHWDPIWNATQDAGLPITFHIDAGREMNVWPGYDPATNLVKITIMSFLGNTDAISEVIFSGLCHRYPDLDFVSVESGVGYIPYLLESMDWQWINLGLDKAHPERDLLPSEYFRRQVYGSFWFEQESALRIIDLIQDNAMYETDFPHPTSITPGAFEFSESASENLERKFENSGISEEILRKVLHDNAAKVYNLD